VLGMPVHLLIVRDDLLLASCRLDKPGVERVVEQRRVATPAEGIRVRVILCFIELALFKSAALDTQFF